MIDKIRCGQTLLNKDNLFQNPSGSAAELIRPSISVREIDKDTV